MNPRKTLMIVFLIVVLVATFAGVGLILTTDFSSSPANEGSNQGDQEDSDNGLNTINLDSDERSNFSVAVITSEDTIRLYNFGGEFEDINLNNYDWAQIDFSLGGRYLSALGSSANSNKDLYIYNLNNETWEQVTQFSTLTEGVTSLVWSDESLLYFFQGQGLTNWLHNFDFETFTQVLKINNIDGEALDSSVLTNDVIVKNTDNEIYIFDSQGDLVADLSNVVSSDTDQQIIIEDAFFTIDPNKIIIKDNLGSIYKMEIDEMEAFEMQVEDSFIPVCSISTNILLGYGVEESNISLKTYNTLNESEEILSTYNLLEEEVLEDEIRCVMERSLLIPTTFEQNKFWYLANLDTFANIEFLDNAKHVDIIRK